VELNGGLVTFWMFTSSGWTFARATTITQAGQWYHVAATYQGGAARVYLNGVASNVVQTAQLTQGNGFFLGGAGNFPYFAGDLDELRISNTVRYSSNFVPANAPFNPDANTLLLWHFNEESGQTIVDISASGNNGILGITGSVESSDPVRVSGYPFQAVTPTNTATNTPLLPPKVLLLYMPIIIKGN
jgi:hypothetical protein